MNFNLIKERGDKKKIIGCVHAGWKGALNGVIKNTVLKFKELDSKTEDSE